MNFVERTESTHVVLEARVALLMERYGVLKLET